MPGRRTIPTTIIELMMGIMTVDRDRRHPEQDDPGQPLDKDIDDLPPGETAAVAKAPDDLVAALDALQGDHEFLLRGDVFTANVIETWIDYKRKNEVDALRLRPHPYEFCLYNDI